MGKGKLIVLEGLDGAGKATQSRLLYQRLRREGVDCRRLNFPRYGEKSCGPVELYLRGELGEKPGDVNGYAASAFFAVDRYCSFRQDWGEYYDRGGLLIADRYTTSNAVHQAAKLDREHRKEFLDWLFHFEYKLMELPEPSAVFYLDLPVELAQELMHSRQAANNTVADIHERDPEYMRSCRDTGAQLVQDYGWLRLDCAKDGQMRPAEEILEELFQRVREIL